MCRAGVLLHPARPDGRQAQLIAYAAADSASLFVYLVVSAQLLLTTPQNYNTFKGNKKKSENLIKSPKAKIKRSRHGKYSSPSKHPHFPQLCDWWAQRRGGSGMNQWPDLTAASMDQGRAWLCCQTRGQSSRLLSSPALLPSFFSELRFGEDNLRQTAWNEPETTVKDSGRRTISCG